MSEGRWDVATDSPAAVAREALSRGERLLWADRAVANRHGRGWLVLLLFGACFAGFAAFWMALAFVLTRGETGIFVYFPYFGIPFLLVGIGVASSPLWVWLFRVSTVYALTDSRILIIVGRKRRMLRSLDIAAIGDLQWVQREDGSGDILFGKTQADADGRGLVITGMYGIPRVGSGRARASRSPRRGHSDA